MQYLDLHTHVVAQSVEVYGIQSLHLSESTFLAMPKLKPISIGLHPWYTSYADLPVLSKYLKVLAQQQNVLMIGECGLDKLRGEAMDKQLEILKFQLALADQLGKPVVLHCVKAFEELIQLKKELKPTVPLIIHGFQKKPQLAEQLINQGFYLSFGAALLDSAELQNFLKMYQGIFFLETDEGAISIQAIYQKLAELKKITVEELKDIIFANWQQIGLLLDYQ